MLILWGGVFCFSVFVGGYDDDVFLYSSFYASSPFGECMHDTATCEFLSWYLYQRYFSKQASLRFL